MIRYKPGVDVFALLNAAGWSTYRLRQERVMGERALQKIRDGKLPSWEELNRLCGLLHCQPFDLLQYIPDDKT